MLNPPHPHLRHITPHTKGIINQRKERQQTNTDFTIYAMNSFGGTTKLSDEIFIALANGGSMKGHWEGNVGKLYRKLQTMQSVVMARTQRYADKASLRVSELLPRSENKHDSSACAAPVCFFLETAVNLRAICRSIYPVYFTDERVKKYYAAPTSCNVTGTRSSRVHEFQSSGKQLHHHPIMCPRSQVPGPVPGK